jgi:hypothetical protein
MHGTVVVVAPVGAVTGAVEIVDGRHAVVVLVVAVARACSVARPDTAASSDAEAAIAIAATSQRGIRTPR